MRQSRKETKMGKMTRESLSPERREALFYMELAPAELGDAPAGEAAESFRGGRRPLPGGRG